MFGPYPAKNNDATILEDIMETNIPFRELLQADDVMLLDRGFRDCISSLKSKYKIITKMPTCKQFIYMNSL